MTDRPIIFQPAMVRAILDGRKTQTRRVLAPQPAEFTPHVIDIGRPYFDEDEARWGQIETEWSSPSWNSPMDEPMREVFVPLPIRFATGDRLWVREAWRAWWEYNDSPPSKIPSGADVQYVADNPLSTWDTRFRQSIHMPRWASRLTLIVTGVKIERLQDISDEDAKAEGCGLYVPGHGFVTQDDLAEGYSNYLSPRMGFEAVWTEINGQESWAENPWVVALTFQVHRCNIDSLPDAGKAA